MQAVEAFAASAISYYDAILMDIMMPELGGYDATSAIRKLKRPDALKISIIAMTANTFSVDIAKEKALDMNEYLSKPLDIAKMLQVLSKCRKQMN